MLLEDIELHINQIATRKAKEFQKYHNNLELIFQREQRRIKNPEKKEIKIPEEWKIDKKYNPFYVLKHQKQIAKSIFNKLINGTYKPFKPYLKQLPKKNSNKTRPVHIFQIPDEAVSNYFYNRLLSKNKHRFSSFSYAYRNDRNVHYAIQDIALDIKANPRMFVAEFDFRDFFGSINHDYLIEQLNQNGFLISEFEKTGIKVFLDHFPKGIPQGTSISLFLANIACWRLDKKLELEGLRFARYADDTVIWSESYTKICKSFDIMQDFSRETGVEINFDKSHGISLLSKKGMPSEFYSDKNSIEFLGYQLSGDTVSIKPNSVNKIKQHISYLLYKNLIQPLNKTPLQSVKIPSDNNDSHFVTAIMQIRRYLYGNLSEYMLKNYLNGSYKRLNFKGVMSFYPLIDDEEQMKQLDRWLLSTILNSLNKRAKLLLKHGFNRDNQFPFNLTKNNLIEECKNKKVHGRKGLVEIPSFTRIYQAIKEEVLVKGIEKTMHPKSNEYSY
ncbi:reverse transcriptase domain-containing protein [Bacillus wiedmannii]|uniref:RNA-dependent DNA polymerase n=1 Tax=Bacillus wiedmannii TaxID=1890302 RepID=A0ABD6TN24_9BACI|nr:reverse transcriptase domain-containing protein [Bacillus wiedmannii]PEO58307.1 RNA-dependent DNA polymerase [Bacillus wiedmannii]PGC75957.1 RNA-dependent DNA polymerase [Bacillus wiedmannii]PHG19446.1 RNA-dependent DNA polymerase [Bacillus wiedmannii]